MVTTGTSSEVQRDLNGNTVFFMYPKTSRSTNKTYSDLVKTTDQFSNFEISAEIKTHRHLR